MIFGFEVIVQLPKQGKMHNYFNVFWHFSSLRIPFMHLLLIISHWSKQYRNCLITIFFRGLAHCVLVLSVAKPVLSSWYNYSLRTSLCFSKLKTADAGWWRRLKLPLLLPQLCDDEAVVVVRGLFFKCLARGFDVTKNRNRAIPMRPVFVVGGWTPRAKNSLRAKSKAPATGQYTPKPRNDNTVQNNTTY